MYSSSVRDPTEVSRVTYDILGDGCWRDGGVIEGRGAQIEVTHECMHEQYRGEVIEADESK